MDEQKHIEELKETMAKVFELLSTEDKEYILRFAELKLVKSVCPE